MILLISRLVSLLLLLLSRFSCVRLCDPRDGSPPGSPVYGILQARTLEWVAISFPNAWKGEVKVKTFSRVRLFATPWTAAHPAPPSMGFSRQEYWSGVPLPSPSKSRQWKLNYRSAEKNTQEVKSCPVTAFIKGMQFASFKSVFYNFLLHNKTCILMIQTIEKEKSKVIIKLNP